MIKPGNPANYSTPLAPLYVFCSSEVLLLQEVVDELRQSARAQGYTEREIYDVGPHFSWAHVIASQQSMSLFGDQKIIELRISSGKPGKEGGEAIKNIINNLSDDVLLIVTLPRLDKASKSSVWFKALSSAAGRNLTDIGNIELNQLPAWIKERLSRHQQSVSPDTLQWLAMQFEGNLLAAHQEIQKLALLYPAGEISEDDVHESVLNVARYDAFKITEAILAGDVARTSRMIEGLKAEGESIVPIIWSITNDIRTLTSFKIQMEAGDSLTYLMKQNRIWGLREKLIPKVLPRLPLNYLKRALLRTSDLDRMAKGLDKSDPWDATLHLATQISQRIAKTAQTRQVR